MLSLCIRIPEECDCSLTGFLTRHASRTQTSAECKIFTTHNNARGEETRPAPSLRSPCFMELIIFIISSPAWPGLLDSDAICHHCCLFIVLVVSVRMKWHTHTAHFWNAVALFNTSNDSAGEPEHSLALPVRFCPASIFISRVNASRCARPHVICTQNSQRRPPPTHPLQRGASGSNDRAAEAAAPQTFGCIIHQSTAPATSNYVSVGGGGWGGRRSRAEHCPVN